MTNCVRVVIHQSVSHPPCSLSSPVQFVIPTQEGSQVLRNIPQSCIPHPVCHPPSCCHPNAGGISTPNKTNSSAVLSPPSLSSPILLSSPVQFVIPTQEGSQIPIKKFPQSYLLRNNKLRAGL